VPSVEGSRLATIEGAGVELAYVERGAGEPILLVHGIAADSKSWESTQEALASRARTIAYDRRGYGGSGAPEPYERTTVSEQAEDAVALLHARDAAPAILCGADLGALVCLDLLVRHAPLARAAVLIDPPLYAFVAAATEALSRERVVLEQALRAGGRGAAVDAYLVARGCDEAARAARARARPGTFFADYGALASWPVARRELRAITAPLVVIRSERAAPHDHDAAEALVALVPGARLVHGEKPARALAELL